MNFEKAGEIARKRRELDDQADKHKAEVAAEAAAKTPQRRFSDAWDKLEALANRKTGFGNSGVVMQLSALTKEGSQVVVGFEARNDSMVNGETRSIQASWSADREAIGQPETIVESQLSVQGNPEMSLDVLAKVEESITNAERMLELPNHTFNVIGLQSLLSSSGSHDYQNLPA
jgi:hypothetical protein